MRAVIEERNDLCERWKASQRAHQALRAELAEVGVDRDHHVTQAEELRVHCGQLAEMLRQLQEKRVASLLGMQVRVLDWLTRELGLPARSQNGHPMV
jgi:hypothetical protein